jgi:hypothetical protein
MTVLRGPADPDHYRVKVGRYGDRWYTDPLPTCPIADGATIWADSSDWQGPSWSIVKGAAGKDWSYVTNKRNGHTARAELERIAGLEPDERTAAFNLINKRGLEQAGGRGTIVHWWAEDLLAGRTPREVTEPMLFTARLPKAALVEAYEYLPALQAPFAPTSPPSKPDSSSPSNPTAPASTPPTSTSASPMSKLCTPSGSPAKPKRLRSGNRGHPPR